MSEDHSSDRRQAQIASRYRRVQRLIEEELDDLSDEIIDRAREEAKSISSEFDDFENTWDAMCCCLAKHDPADWQPFEHYLRGLCQSIAASTERFLLEAIATFTDGFDTFEKTGGLRDKPSINSQKEWCAEAIYQAVFLKIKEASNNGPFSYSIKLLDQLKTCLLSLTPFANGGADLVGLGIAVDALERFRRGRPVDVALVVECGYRSDDKEFEEGIFASVGVTDQGVELSCRRTTYEEELGSGHVSEVFDFDMQGFEKWLKAFDEIRNGDTKLTVARS